MLAIHDSPYLIEELRVVRERQHYTTQSDDSVSPLNLFRKQCMISGYCNKMFKQTFPLELSFTQLLLLCTLLHGAQPFSVWL